MELYRWIWTGGWSLVAAVPVLLGLLVTPPAAMLVTGVVAAACAAILTERVSADAGAAGVVAAALVAACWSTGPPVLAGLLLAATTSPTALDRLLGDRARTSSSPDAVAGPRWLAGLADDRLCAAWSESYVALARAADDAERLAIVNVRQSYLDELEKRDATGFRCWLDSGARPVGNPAPFIRRR